MKLHKKVIARNPLMCDFCTAIFCDGCYRDHQNAFITKTIVKKRSPKEEEVWKKQLDEAKDDTERERLK